MGVCCFSLITRCEPHPALPHHRSHAYYDDSQVVVGSVITSIVEVVFIAAAPVYEKGPGLAGAQCFLKNFVVAPAEEDANAGNTDSLVSDVVGLVAASCHCCC